MVIKPVRLVWYVFLWTWRCTTLKSIPISFSNYWPRKCRNLPTENNGFAPSGSFQHKLQYSGTPPYDHPVYKTTSLLRPYSFKPKVKNIDSFYYFQDPVNATTSLLRPGFYGPTVVVLTGLHCTIIFYFISVCCRSWPVSSNIKLWLNGNAADNFNFQIRK